MKPGGLAGVLVATLALAPATALAHPVPFSYLDLRIESRTIDASLVVHVIDLARDLSIEPSDQLLDPAFAKARESAIADLVARRLGIFVGGRRLAVRWSAIEVLTERQSVRLTARVPLDEPVGAVGVEGRLFPYDPQHQTFINVYEADALTQVMLDSGRSRVDYFTGTRRGRFAVVSKFIPAGISHIMIGPDHVLFLVGLLLLGGTMRRLALVVTGFTLAHSVTLTLAATGILSPPASLIEPAIALSIVYVGADNLLKRDGRDARIWIAFGFGFIHGFGFANVLQAMDLPAQALGWSLFSFNLGVEIGQLLIVAVVATAFAVLRSRSELVGRRLAFVGSIGVMTAGAFWFIERLAFAGGL